MPLLLGTLLEIHELIGGAIRCVLEKPEPADTLGIGPGRAVRGAETLLVTER